MQNNQDDAYAPRRAELDAQFHALQSAGSEKYWQRIEEENTAQRLPLEVLARCFRERHAAGIRGDAERIFTVIVERVKRTVGWWAGSTAKKARSGGGSISPEDLEQECYMKLWKELAGDGPTFLLENFAHKLERICQHVAHSEMGKAGEWVRHGVVIPTRVPRKEMESIDATLRNDEDPPPHAAQPVDTKTQDAFDLAEYSDLFDEIRKLPAEMRQILYDRFYRGRAQDDTAADLGFSSRTLRNHLKAILEDLRKKHQGGEEDSHV